MSAKRKTARLVLRLEPFGAPASALFAVARLARAMEAEFAARLINDNRLADALAFNAPNAAPQLNLHYVERSLRRRIKDAADEADAAWSFDVAECAGVFASECALHEDDMLAIALPDVERMMDMLRAEISSGLARSSGVLLMPRTSPPPQRPVIGVISHASGLESIVAAAAQLAERLRSPLAFVAVDTGDLAARVQAQVAALTFERVTLHLVPTSQLEIMAAFVRSLRPMQVVAAPRPSTIREFLTRPRLLREMSAPVLLLPASED